MEAKPPEVTVSELRLLLQKHWQATGRKQKQIGETLHSEAGQLLTALKLYLSLLEEKLDNSSNADVLDILEKMDALLDEKTESIHCFCKIRLHNKYMAGIFCLRSEKEIK